MGLFRFASSVRPEGSGLESGLRFQVAFLEPPSSNISKSHVSAFSCCSYTSTTPLLRGAGGVCFLVLSLLLTVYSGS